MYLHSKSSSHLRDTRIGILHEEIGRIFEPFYRGENARAEPGIGLGLSFVKEVAELYGGKFWGLSEPLKGSTFSILLPAGKKRKGKEVETELTKT